MSKFNLTSFKCFTKRVHIVSLLLLFASISYSQTAIYEVNSLQDTTNAGCGALCTFRDAVIAAADDRGPSNIIFQNGLTGTIILNSELTLNSTDLAIIGPGPEILTVSGNNNSRVLVLTSVNISVKGLTIADGNSSNAGSGISVTGNNTVLENLRVINNTSTSQGAGIDVFFASTIIRNCEISGNTAPTAAGINISGGAGNDVLLENITISGNSGDTLYESGIAIQTNASQNITLRYVTLTNNSGSESAASLSGVGSIAVESSIFADNLNTNQDINIGSNVTINNSILKSFNGSINGTNNITGQSPNLLALAFFSGSALKVHALADASSVAYNHVDVSIGDSQCGTGVTKDQTGFPRPNGASCDAGAFELDFVNMIFNNGFE